jgi:TPP-dependent pyruvate/acetoin dehydrogenase alpha subunit
MNAFDTKICGTMTGRLPRAIQGNMVVRKVNDTRDHGTHPGAELNLEHYRRMVIIRRFEEELLTAFRNGEVLGTTHKYRAGW